MGRFLSLLALLTIAGTLSAAAGFDEGVGAFGRKDHAAALRIFRAEADRGHAGADYYLGRMHLMGEGVSADYQQAAAFFHKSAGKGHATAQYYLGALYYLGEGVSKDYSKAHMWYRRAAAQGDRVAQYSLGIMHAAAVGVPKDNVQALMWFSLAAKASYKPAAKFRDLLARTMTRTDIAKAKRLTRDRNRTRRKQ